MTLLDKLQDLGFQNLFTYRIGPCFQCEKEVQTFFNIDLRRWYCENCWYDIDFIRELELQFPLRKNMAQQMSYEELLAKFNALESKTKTIIATRENNVFIGGTPPGSGNLTLKYRQLSPRGWGVPTKGQNGVAYFRCSDFPFTFDISPDRKAVRVYTAIPASAEEIALFEQRFIGQQIVVAKPRKTKEESESANATASAFGSPSAPTPQAPPAPAASTSRSFSTLSQPEQAALIAEADKLMTVQGLFKSKLDALQSVLQPKNISLP